MSASREPARGLGRLATGSVIVALACGLAACREAPSEPQEPELVASPGAVLYLTYCQSCHGTHGVGDGPAARALRTPPADLTQLWTRYGTPLDRARVAEYIDGRRLVSLHGWREMPIWGEEFFEDSPPDAPGLDGLKERLIDVLVGYLQSIQRQQET